ncbi:MAG: amino acid adenylation domain-containing protein, partial [Candidatus Eremiobacterota bacterium]
EIEEVFKKIDSIKDAVVVDRGDKQGNKYLCGYYISDIKLKSSELQKELSQFLPDYMIPSCFIKIDTIPVTAHGKVDRKSLPEPQESDLASHETYVAPRNDREEIFARIWKKVLKCDRVGIYDNFFRLGGDSIMSIQVVARANSEGINITASTLLRHPTIAEISEKADRSLLDKEKIKSCEDHTETLQGIEPGRTHFIPSDFPLADVSQSFLDSITDFSSVEAIYGLSPLQEGFLFYALSAPDSFHYCTQVSWIYDEETDIDALKEAWHGIFAAHSTFRAGFVWEEGRKPFQVVYRHVPLPWHTVDLRGKDREEQEKIIENTVEKARRSISDLKTPPAGSLYLFILDDYKYRFLWSYHHIILDGWSMPLILMELQRRYNSIVKKETFSFVPPGSFETYIKWLSFQDKERLTDYWKHVISDFSSPTPLTVNYSRPDIHKAVENPGEYVYKLPERFLEVCQKFASSGEVTLNALLQLAWASVLSTYSGSDDILYGIPVSGRPAELPGVEQMIGLFINTIPLRVKLNHHETVRYNLKHIHNIIQDGSNLSHISLSEVQAMSSIPPGEALFYSLFVFENFPFSEEITAMKDMKHYGTSSYPLNIVVVPAKEISINISYDGDCFTEDVIKNLASHIASALKWIVEHPEELLKNIDVIPEDEKNRILNVFNDTYYDVPKEKTIHELIETQASLNPERTAVVYKDEKFTYRELNEKANKLAHFLRQEGVKRDSRVGIFLDRSCHMIVSILAVLKAGGAFVPIDPHYPPERINYIISDSGSLMLITDSHLAEKINPSIPVFYTSDYDNMTSRYASRVTRHDSHINPEHINSSKDLVYMIYTSGSTGQPKGVMIEHHSLVNLSFYYKRKYNFSEHDNMAKYVSFGFDASIPEIFPALISGAGIHIIPEEIRLSPSGLNEYFERNNVTLAILPTQFGEQFMLLTDNKSLRWIQLGGDKLKVFKNQNYVVTNGYGPTEYTVCTSDFIIDKSYENIPVGKPIYNTHVYILDKYGKITPAGVPGELCVSGEGVARGYLNREELTKEKFVENPFVPGKRMYRTGDLARWLSDGNLEFLGRIDQQVKIRGFRIELGEIEEALKKIDPVRDAVVIDRSDKQGNKYLCAYYISDIKLKSSELQKELSQFLPDYMIPSCFLKIDKIPVTSHGKVDRKSLPPPQESDMASHETYVAPRNEREEILAAIWKKFLKCDRVGIYDNFFHLGGDSIMSIQIVAKANSEGINITASQLLRHPTIAELAEGTEMKPAIQAEQKVLTGEVPLIPVQKWFFEHEFEDLNHFNQAFLFTLKEDGNRDIIEKTLNVLVNHHDGLRLRFRKEDMWIQWYENPEKASVSVEQIDLSSVPEDILSVFITEKCNSLQSSLNITEGPVIRSSLFKGHKDGLDRLFIVIHHLCIDMVSWRIIIEDFHNIYRTLSDCLTPSLPAKTSSYRDWAKSLMEYVSTAEKHSDYWLEVLRDVSPIPVKYKESKFSDIREYKVSLSPHDTDLLLNAVPSVYNTQINDILLSALLLACNRSLNVSDMVINLEGHGREESIAEINLSNTVGWFTSIFPVRLKSPSPADYGSVIKSVKETLRAIPEHGISYGVLRYFSHIKEELKELECKRLAFNYLGQIDGSVMEGELLCAAEEDPGHAVSLQNGIINLLDINGLIFRGSLSMVFGYSSLIWDEETVKGLADNFISALKDIITHCIEPGRKHFTPSDFPLAEVSQSFLDGISDPSSVEAIYGLSPLQEGLLFHAVASPDSDQYCTQTSWIYKGDLDINALKEAWNGIFSSNPIFRTAFVWEETEKPFQIVYRNAPLPWYTIDVSEMAGEKQEEKIENIRIKIRREGFNLSRPPLAYLHLFILGKNEYRFIWTCHHILIDGWSLPLIMQELKGRYESIVNKETLHLKPAKPFETYIQWLSEQDREEIISYWKNTLSDFSAPTPVTVNRGDLDIHKSIENLKEYIHYLPEDFTAECQNFARSNLVTLNALVQLAWASVLSLYSGSEDILYGTTVSGRPPELSGVENMIGLFINTIPMRAKLNHNESVLYNLKNIHNTIQEGNNLSHISLNKLQPLASIPPGESLFYSLFVFENYPFEEDPGEKKSVVMTDVKGYEKTNYPLNVIIGPGKELCIKISCDGDCFTEQVIENMKGHIESALEWIVRNSESPLKDMDILSEREKHLLLKTFNDNYFEVPQDTTIQELIEKQVELNSEKIAVIYKDTKLSYRELNERANKLACVLRREGVTRDTRVAILLDRSCHMIVSVLAAVKSGGCYVPIDPEYPIDRIKYIISDSSALLLITEPHLAEKIKPSVKVLDITDPSLYTELCENLPVINTSKNLAYIIYTSGSTGQPKGVMIEHRSLVNMCFWYKHTRQLSEKDSMTKYASFGFDASVWEIFPCLISGASLHVIGEDIRLSPSELNTYYEENNITVSFLPTQFTEQFIEMFENKSLRWLDTGGDKLRSFKKKSYDVVNNYGPTEYTVCTTSFAIDKYYENIPIGKPVYNTTVYILDKHNRMTPLSVPGELCISGPGMARGYLNRPDLTKEKFVENPIEPGQRMYRTGDLARWLPDGNIEFLGRIDQQVKIRGFRIELGEIEEALKKIDPVRDSVVIDRTDKQGNKYLCGYYISDIKLKSSELQKELSQFLPDYMIPSCFIKIDKIPVTAHGKVDRKSLPEPQESDLASHETYVAPRNDREEILARIWKKVLKCDRVGIYDNFFSLGGDSIMSIQVVTGANNEGIPVTASQLLRHPTIAKISEEIEKKLSPQAEKGMLKGEVPLLPVQEWFFEQELENVNHFNQSLLFTLKQPGDNEIIEKALNILVNHHDGLRLRFRYINGDGGESEYMVRHSTGTDGKWIQWYEHPEKTSVSVETINLSSLSEDSLYMFITETCNSIQNSLNITEGPVIRGALFKNHKDGKDRFFIVIHRLCTDMVSWRIILEDFCSIYRKLSDDETPVLPDKTASYRDYSEGLRK